MRSSVKWGQTTWFLFVQPHGKVGPSSIRQNLCRIHTFHRLDVHHCSLIMILLSILSFPAFRRALKTACFINSWGFPLSVLNSCCQLNMSSIFILIHHIHVDHQMTHHFFPLLFFQYVKDIWSMARNVSASALLVDDPHSDSNTYVGSFICARKSRPRVPEKLIFLGFTCMYIKKFSHKYKNT